MNNLQQNIIDFINLEYETQKIKTVTTWQLPLEQRIAKGDAISNITNAQIFDGGIALYCPENYSRFAPGDRVILNYGNPQVFPKYHCEFDQEDGNWLYFLTGWKENINRFFNVKNLVIDRDFVDLRDILLDAINKAFAKDSIINIIDGIDRPNFINYKMDAIFDLLNANGFQLNNQQFSAIQKAYAAENYYAIQGPPGTGKTYVLGILAAILAGEGKRVFVTAFSHHAINNALLKAIKFYDINKVIKIGSHNKALELENVIANYEYFNESGLNPHANDGLIIGGTCLALHTRRLQDLQFDVIIFDEAGQLTIPLALAGMTAGAKYIFIGDHKQMPPVFSADVKDDFLKKSVFEVITDHSPGTMLDVTYRMSQTINTFPSNRFYGGLLRSDSSCSNSMLNLTKLPQNGFNDILSPDFPNVFCEIQHEKPRKSSSPEEVVFIADLFQEMFGCGITGANVAVITPFRAQARLIRKELEVRNIDCSDIIIDTVEKIQGQEKDIIIMSLAASDPVYLEHIGEFYYLPNRFNVIITRCKTKRIIVGDRRVFIDTAKPKLKEWVEIFQDYYENAKVVKI